MGKHQDLQTLFGLAYAVRTNYTIPLRGAEAAMDTALLHVAQTLGEETSRQLDWLCTQVKQTARQALTVEANKMSELKAALPGKPVVNAIPDAN